jgi:hypothetical protein
MTIADTRSGIQVAAAQGSASQTDFNLGAAVFGRRRRRARRLHQHRRGQDHRGLVPIFPGFMMLSGSSARLMVRIMSTAPRRPR